MTRELPVANADALLVGTVIGASGLRGELKVKSFTAAPENIGHYGPLFCEDGRNFSVAGVRAQKGDVVLVRLKGIEDRASAQKLKGLRLYVSRAALPQPAADEFYHADLMGLRVEDENGHTLGAVRAVHNFGAGDIIEVEDAKGKSRMFPFTRDIVPEVDVAAGRMVAVLPPLSED
ncbi:MAG: ribosome maturation factor RimM [Alphaproteobacteria bacterium]